LPDEGELRQRIELSCDLIRAQAPGGKEKAAKK
jgi:hypothetical protein